jgi:catalase (peroxidase I)
MRTVSTIGAQNDTAAGCGADRDRRRGALNWGARETQLIIGSIERLKARQDVAAMMIACNYARTLEVCDRGMPMQLL